MGITEKNMKTTGIIGAIWGSYGENGNYRNCRGYIGIMEDKMGAAIWGLVPSKLYSSVLQESGLCHNADNNPKP